ncbi:MAG: NTP transferase domain-containing protein, partial [Jiangellaceae bacterium]
AAGVDALPVDVDAVVVLAADLPSVTPELIHRLVDERRSGAASGVAVLDATGRVQPLVACYEFAALGAALRRVGDPRDRSMRALLDNLRVSTIRDDVSAADIDTAEDLNRARRRP